MEKFIYNLLNAWSKKKFDQGCESHYTGIEIYCKDKDAQGLYLQRDRKSGDLNYFRWSNRKINFGMTWIWEAARTKDGHYVYNERGAVWNKRFERYWLHLYFPPFTWIAKWKEYRKDKREWLQKKAMLDSGEYTMDPMGTIHHIDDDQAAYYE